MSQRETLANFANAKAGSKYQMNIIHYDHQKKQLGKKEVNEEVSEGQGLLPTITPVTDFLTNLLKGQGLLQTRTLVTDFLTNLSP